MPASSTRDLRLSAEYDELRSMRSDVIGWEVLGSRKPPDQYKIHYNLRSIVAVSATGTPIYHTGFDVTIKYPAEFPRTSPDVRFVDNQPFPLHPNIWSFRKICLEGTQHWIPGIGVSLVSIIQMVGDIIAFREINLGSPANSNKEIRKWIQDNLHFAEKTRVSNPVDSSPIRLADASDAIQFGDEASYPLSDDRIQW